MTEIIGEFSNDLPQGQEYLTLVFSPSSVPLKQRWRTNGLSADFMADYFATFFPGKEGNTTEADLQAEVKSAVSFIGNELLENSMKFTDDTLDYPISLTLQMHNDKLVFIATNSVKSQGIEKFQAFVQELATSDTDELYLRHLEQNGLDEGDFAQENAVSGLGLLTMINDYQAKLGWKFEAIQNASEAISVTTMVQLLV
jgi:hypothetical protein